jgi:hypothetical protein
MMIAVYSLAISCVVLQIDPAVRAQRKRVGARGAFSRNKRCKIAICEAITPQRLNCVTS